MRLSIRWQRFVEEYLKCAHDVQCEVLDFDPLTMKGRAQCTLLSIQEVPSGWPQNGELVELLNDFRALVVGKINGAESKGDFRTDRRFQNGSQVGCKAPPVADDA